jgi:Zn-dependent protease
MDFSPDHIRTMVVQLIALVLSITVHEFGHAYVADWLGDRLPRHQGRVTLNPVAHADPIGTIALPVMGMLFAGGVMFGWGRPVMVNPTAFSRRFRVRTSHMLVALAGPAMNILFAMVISVVFLVLYRTHTGPHQVHLALLDAVMLNFGLAVFNLLPAPPLDGGTVLAGLLPDSLQPAYRAYQPYGIFVLAAVLLIPSIGRIVFWPALWMTKGWMGVLGVF